MSRTLGVALFPIELLTYVMRPVSIICRLCANIMSGHVIMKVILQSLFTLPSVKAFSFVASFWVGIVLSFLFPLLLLELAVSVIQVYVFLVMFYMFMATRNQLLTFFRTHKIIKKKTPALNGNP